MRECVCLSGCLFFNDKMENMPSMAQMYKEKYCLGNNSQCARYMVLEKKGKDQVPKNLFPNQVERAKELLS